MHKVKQFIHENWDGTLRSEPKDRESLIGLPYPYTVPSINYNFEERTVCDFVSAASFYALFVGLCTSEQAAQTIKLLERLEQPHGLACCEPRKDLLDLQWDYPHGWACLHYIAIEGLRRYGYAEDAYRLAVKYCDTVELNFDETENLWENYNMVTGKVSITKEGNSQITMLGWSAGVYLHCAELCGR